MDSSQPQPTTIDDYIAAYPEDIQARLRAMRETIRAHRSLRGKLKNTCHRLASAEA